MSHAAFMQARRGKIVVVGGQHTLRLVEELQRSTPRDDVGRGIRCRLERADNAKRTCLPDKQRQPGSSSRRTGNLEDRFSPAEIAGHGDNRRQVTDYAGVVLQDHRMAVVRGKKRSQRLQVAAKARLFGKGHEAQPRYRPSYTVLMHRGETSVCQCRVPISPIDGDDAMEWPRLLGELRRQAFPTLGRAIEVDGEHSEIDGHASFKAECRFCRVSP